MNGMMLLAIKDERRVLAGTFVLSTLCLGALETANVMLKNKDHLWSYCQRNVDIGKANWCEAQEADMTLFMVEPANSRSNYPYFTFGVYCILLGMKFEQKLQVDHGTLRISNDIEKEKKDASLCSGSIHNFTDTVSASADAGTSVDDYDDSDTVSQSFHDISNDILSESTEIHIKYVEMSQLNSLYRFPILVASYGVSLIALAFGSFWYHASQCRIANHFDGAAMFSMTVFPGLYCLVALIPQFQDSRRVLLVPLTQILLYVGEFVIGFDDKLLTMGLIIFSLSMMIILTIVRFRTHSFRYWLAILCLVLGASATVVWQLDRTGVICQVPVGHAYWHVGTCLASVSGGFFLRSETLVHQTEERYNDDAMEETTVEDRLNYVSSGIESI